MHPNMGIKIGIIGEGLPAARQGAFTPLSGLAVLLGQVLSQQLRPTRGAGPVFLPEVTLAVINKHCFVIRMLYVQDLYYLVL